MTHPATLALLRAAKTVAREKYAWPGGYEMHLVMTDGGCLCSACVKSEWPQIARSTLRRDGDGWGAEGAAVNWEDPDLVCAHCGAELAPAYGAEDDNPPACREGQQ